MTSISFDLIVVSRTMDAKMRAITQNCIDSCLDNRTTKAKVNVILVETSGCIDDKYTRVNEVVLYHGNFVYNKALNKGLEKAVCTFHILANNDLYFHKGWDEIGELMRLNHYLSSSAMSQDARQKMFRVGNFAHEGYLIGKQLTGWCIFIDHKILEKIKKLPEKHEFWYSDDDYAAQLKFYKIKHALIGCCRVDHVHNGSNTLVRLDRLTRKRYTRGH